MFTKKKFLLLIFSSIFLVVQTSLCQKVINWQAIDATGAGQSSQGARMMYSSFGQPSVGVSTAGSRVLNSGYLYIRIVPQGAPFIVTQSSVNFGNVIVGQSTTQPLTIQNTGGAALNITATNISPADFTIVSGGGAQTIPAGGSTNVQMRFQPSSAGNKSGTLAILSNASNAPTFNVSLSGIGTATAPNLLLSSSALNFGSLTIGSNFKMTVTLNNIGNAPLTVSAQTIGGTNASEFSVTHQSGNTIAAGGSDFVEIQFAPTSVGSKNAELNFTTNDPNHASVAVSLSGQATSGTQPQISLSTTLLNFGTTPPGTPVTQDVVVSNTGTAVLTLSSQTVSGAGFTLLQPAGTSINPGANSTARIQFNPSAAGSWQGIYNITSNDPVSPTVTVNLLGTGGSVTGPRISLNRSVIDFGNVPILTLKEEDVIIRNIGTSDLTISNQTILGTGAQHFSITQPANTPIAAGGSSTARIRCIGLSGGNKIARYAMQTNDPGMPNAEVVLAAVIVGLEKLPDIPREIRLHQNYPNPFSLIEGQSTNITYEVDVAASVHLEVYNTFGQSVAMLVNQHQDAGTYNATFDANNLPAGMYSAVLRVVNGSKTYTQRIMMMLVK